MATTLLIPEAKVCFGCFREDRNGPLHVEKNTLWSMTVLWIEPEATDLVSAAVEASESERVELFFFFLHDFVKSGAAALRFKSSLMHPCCSRPSKVQHGSFWKAIQGNCVSIS